MLFQERKSRMFFFRKRKEAKELAKQAPSELKKADEAWQEVSAWIETVDDEEIRTVSLISSAIAMADRPEGRFTVKKVWQRNPEAELVSVIAAAVCTATEESHLTVCSIRTISTAQKA